MVYLIQYKNFANVCKNKRNICIVVSLLKLKTSYSVSGIENEIEDISFICGTSKLLELVDIFCPERNETGLRREFVVILGFNLLDLL